MLPLAHAGIPLGAAWLWHSVASRPALSDRGCQVSEKNNANHVSGSSGNPSHAFSLVERLDYRFLLLGALLPDLLDKLVGQVLLADTFSNGRIVGHTMLFVVLILAFGIWLRVWRGSAGLIWLSFGCLAHLVLDEIWLTPQTFLWPLYGWSFERLDLSNWVQGMVTALVTMPKVFIPEIIGAMVLVAFLVKLLRSGQVRVFFRTGLVA